MGVRLSQKSRKSVARSEVMQRPPRRRITKRRIAEVQLYRAVKLLQDDVDPISALTLAGAAEEILGRMVESSGRATAFEESAIFARTLWDFAASRAKKIGFPLSVPDEKEIRNRINLTRNELKHNSRGKNTPVEADFNYWAEEMVLRALRNYQVLYNKLPRRKLIADWYENMTL
jgi:hypothetical protein